MKKMLLVFSHPDDESFVAGGTVRMYANEGWNIELICATDGERGMFDENTIPEGSTFSEIRRKELEKAAHVLGIKHVAFLHKPDGGLQNLTPGTLEDVIIKKMEEFLPDIVITYDTTGINNNPDHSKLCYATTYAFQKYIETLSAIKENAVSRKGRGLVWKEDLAKRAFGDVTNEEPKLYYACLPTSVVQFMQKAKQLPGESFGLPWRGTPDKFITTVIDIKQTMLEKGKALLCYQTKENIINQFISFDQNPQHVQEWFLLRMQGAHEVFMGKTDHIAPSL